MEPPSFPNLHTLLLFVNWRKLLSFPCGFFSFMPIITVLDFSNHYYDIDDDDCLCCSMWLILSERHMKKRGIFRISIPKG